MLPVCEETEHTDNSPHEKLGSTLRQTLVPDQERVEDEKEDQEPSTEEGEAEGFSQSPVGRRGREYLFRGHDERARRLLQPDARF